MSKTNRIRYDDDSGITYYGDNYRYYKRLFRKFKEEFSELVRYGMQWFAYGYQAIEILIPGVGKLIYRDGGNYIGTIEWEEHWPDKETIRQQKIDERSEMYQTFLREINYYQKMTGFSQGDIAEATGISRRSINRYLSGAVAPKVSTMRKICESLGIDI